MLDLRERASYTTLFVMPVPLDPVKFDQALRDLGVTSDALKAIQMLPSDKAKILVEEIKAIAKSRYRLYAHQLHPDKTGGDAEKAARFAFLSLVYKHIQQIEAPPFPTVAFSGVSYNFYVAPPAARPNPVRPSYFQTPQAPRVRRPNPLDVVNLKPK